MAGGGSPRQKMINLMYLVLLALLAMNVSKEILNSFALINNGLVRTNENFSVKNDITYDQFDKALTGDPNKVRPYWDRAQAVKKRSQLMFDYIEDIKKELILDVEKKETVEIEGRNGQDSTIKIITDVLHMQGKDDNSTPTHYFFGSADKAEPGNKAFEFKDKIKKYKDDLLSYVPESDRANIHLGLDISDVYSQKEGMKISWESNNFYHNPAIATIALLTKMQNDVKNSESDIINALYRRFDLKSFKFDTVSTRVVANSNYVLIGEQYRAEIFLAAFSTTSNPSVTLGEVDTVNLTIKGPKDTSSVKVAKGIGVYTFSPTTEQTYKYGGLIGMKDPADPKHILYFPFKSEFKAARPAIVVSPDKMNVFYIGVDNPVSISVPGIAAEDLQPSISGGGSIGGVRGKYTVKVTGASKEVTVNVSAKTRTGVKSMGSGITFRVKSVPSPVPEFMGKRGSDVIQQVALKSASAIMAKLDNFEFDLKFPIVSFSVSMNVNGVDVEEKTNGGVISEKQKAMLARAKKGNKVYIEDVRVKMPDGSIRPIGSVNLKVI
ncbi:MAG: gliding motility protein GldM [Bacteroidetes bacterium]|nr:gliding motility protein GldM [Bacteroidota bacterium]